MVKIKISLKKRNQFIPGVGRMRKLTESADSPMASKQTIQQALSARKKKQKN